MGSTLVGIKCKLWALRVRATLEKDSGILFREEASFREDATVVEEF